MKKLFKKLNNAKGAVTIEATLSLTAFLFMFIMIYSIITICRTQATIQVAINATAKELSQYSYLYSITGLHDAMKNVSDGAADTKEDVNEVANGVSEVFAGLQGIKDDGFDLVETATSKDTIGDVDAISTSWDSLMTSVEKTGEATNELKAQVSDMLKPDENGGHYKLIFGLAKLMVSEGYEQVKSLAAEAISRVMMQKHLKRSENDTAENFCRDAGIVPGDYLFTTSYFNGIDFSHSSLLPYKSNTITIVANYKIKLIQLLPIDVEFHVTQTAKTLAWVQGDVEIPDTPEEQHQMLSEDAVWNMEDGSERERLIRSMGLTELKSEGFKTVSGHNYIHAYSSTANPQTFGIVRSYNPLVGLDSVSKVNVQDIVDRLEKISSQAESSTDNIHTIRVKEQDANGNLKTSEVNCDGEYKVKVILVIPEDEGLLKKFEEALGYVDTDVEFEFLPGYGSVFASDKEETVAATEGAGG